MKLLISIILLHLTTGVLAQEIDTAISNQLVRQTIDSYFNKYPNYVDSSEIFFRDTRFIHSTEMMFSDFKVVFVSEREEEEVIKKGLTKLIFTLNLKPMGSDTLDLFVGVWGVRYTDFFGEEMFNYESFCRGIYGGVPDGRLSFNDSLQSWTFQSNDELMSETGIK